MQPELFQDIQSEQQSARNHPPLFPHRYMRMRVAYEDLIFSALSFILILLAGFCLGVERGKRISGPVQPAVVREIRRAPAPVIPAPDVVARAVQPKPVAQAASTIKAGELYVIQLASYVDPQAAHAEAQRLRRRGYDAQVVRQGRYYELRVAGYRQRNEAMTALATLKKTYHDSFVKKVS